MRPAQKPQESFRRFAPNNQYLESYEYDSCYRAKRSRLLAKVVECFGELFQTRRGLRLRVAEDLYRESGTTQGNGKQRDLIGLEELRRATVINSLIRLIGPLAISSLEG